MGETFAEIASGGPLLLAVGVAVVAGLVSFLSPCVLPLVPGYLSYVTGLAGAELDAALGAGTRAADAATTRSPVPAGVSAPPGGVAGPGALAAPGGVKLPGGVAGPGAVAAPGGVKLPGGVAGPGAVAAPGGLGPSGGTAGSGAEVGTGGAVAAPDQSRVGGRSRVLAGTVLFVAGFTAVFVPTVVLLTRAGQLLFAHQRALEIGVGVLIIVLGLAFLGLIPGLQRELRISRLPAAGLLGAPVFGAVFALSWLPCATPTLGAVVGLATVSGQTDRAVILAVAYCLGLGVPFVLFGVAFQRLLGVFRAVRRNSRWVTRIGGALLLTVGVALVTGGWNAFVIWLQSTIGVVEVGL